MSIVPTNLDVLVAHCFHEANWPALESHLNTHGEQWLLESHNQNLTTLLAELPKSVSSLFPWLAYWLGRSQMQTDFPSAKVSLTSAHHNFKSKADVDGECMALIGILDALWLEWADCTLLDPWLDQLSEVRTRLTTLGRYDLLKALSRSAFAGLSIRRPNDSEIGFWEAHCLEALANEPYSSDFLLRGLQLMIHYTWGRGNRAHSTLVFETLRSKQGKSLTDPVGGCIYHVVQAAHQHWFDVDSSQCAETVKRGLALSAQLALPHWDIPMLNCVLFKTCSQEQLEAARYWLDTLSERIQLNPRPHDQAIHYHFRAYLAWLENHPDDAIEFARQAYQIAVNSGFAYSPVYYGIALVAILREKGEWQRALQQLTRTRHLAVSQDSDVMQFMSLMQGADLALQKGKLSATDAYLQRALHIGARQRYFSVPWVRRKNLARLMAIGIDREFDIAYVKSLINALELSPPDPEGLMLSLWPWPHNLRVLGGIEIHSAQNPATAPAGKAPASLHRLLLKLVVAGPEGITSERLQDQLWPEADDQAYARLKTGISRLRSLFQDKEAILHGHQRVRLNPARVWVDAWALEAAAHQAKLLDLNCLVSQLKNWRGAMDTQFFDNTQDLYYPVKLEDAYLRLLCEATSRHEANHHFELSLALWRQAATEMECEPILLGIARNLKALGRVTEANKVLAQLQQLSRN
ncbi:MAG: hypothetical protein ABL919_01020 [Methylococcales bacterium]|nr:hypothetical protein [Methylococcaceae bacterium]